jgi:hypothetical protein
MPLTNGCVRLQYEHCAFRSVLVTKPGAITAYHLFSALGMPFQSHVWEILSKWSGLRPAGTLAKPSNHGFGYLRHNSHIGCHCGDEWLMAPTYSETWRPILRTHSSYVTGLLKYVHPRHIYTFTRELVCKQSPTSPLGLL